MRVAAIGSQLAALSRELAMWEAGNREPLPGVPDLLPPPEAPIDEIAAAAHLKRAEAGNIDRHSASFAPASRTGGGVALG